MVFLRQTIFPWRVLIVMCAQRSPPLKLWYQMPGSTGLPHFTVDGSIAFTSTSAAAIEAGPMEMAKMSTTPRVTRLVHPCFVVRTG